jgi:hypothetical protein
MSDCEKLEDRIEKCLKLNIEVFGEESGIVMCEQLQNLYYKYCNKEI